MEGRLRQSLTEPTTDTLHFHLEAENMSRGDLELLSVTARALRGPLFIWKPFRHLMLFGGQNFSLLFVLFSCHSGMKVSEAGAHPVSGPL